MRVTIATKVALAVVGLIALSLALVGLYLERREHLALVGRLVARLEVQASFLADEIAGGSPISDSWAKRAAARTNARITAIAKSGDVLADSETLARQRDNHADRPEVAAALAQGSGEHTRYSRSVGRDLVYVAHLVTRSPEDPIVLRLSAPVSELTAGYSQFRRDFLGIAFVSLAIASCLAIFWARRIAAQLREMGAFVRVVSHGQPAARLAVKSRDEFGELTEALNALAADLESTLRRLEDETHRLRTIAEGMGEGLLVLDTGERITLLNPVAETLLNLSQDASMGQTLLEVVRSHELDDLLKAAAGKAEPVSAEITLIYPKRRILAGTAVAMRDAAGAPQGTALTLRDITELKRLEEVRMEFVVNVTHELRTPLTAIRGYAETLLDGGLDIREEARKFLEVIHRHAERLGRLLSDLLDLSNIELERTSLHLQSLALPEAVRQVVTTFANQAEQKSVTLRIALPDDLPPVLADRDRLWQILVNLVDNAVKFTPEGGAVTLTARELAAADTAIQRDARQPLLPGAQPLVPRRWVEIGVLDTGIGIPRKDLPRITERFYRVDKARSRDLGGTGLGLSIVKHLVQAHGGSLCIESDLGKGTEVHFTLPASVAEPPLR
jgi:two-component system phosphate regulon sensor histidine kinase PhoR